MNSVRKPKVLGTGLIALDLVIGSDAEGPIRSWTGGTCGNVLTILAYLGWDAFPIARLNGDPASIRVRADMEHWGVHLEHATCAPTADTPIIIQQIRRGRDGRPSHRFSWSCPRCGEWLPRFKAVSVEAAEAVMPALSGASVFFFDRLSRATLNLAARASAEGAVVVFEPSGNGTTKLFTEALRLAHVVKYSNQRFAGIDKTIGRSSAILLEIQTVGEQGLRYSHRFGRTCSGWLHLAAVAAPRLKDSCGSGDWCTAGLIAKIAARGQKGLEELSAKGLREALRYGQALAAWNCSFEGARGGMYAVPREIFEEQIAGLVSGRLKTLPEGLADPAPGNAINCPACPTLSRNLRAGQGTGHEVRKWLHRRSERQSS
jgi:sugar/nucleoside kinase (ribokinase family)